MPQSRFSPFDDHDRQTRLWIKDRTDLLSTDTKILYENYILMLSKKTGICKPKYFVLTPESLICIKRKDSRKCYGEIKIRWTRIYYMTIMHENKSAFLLKFISNMKSATFIVTDEEEFKRWKSYLTPISIQTDFHDKFEVVSLIGAGAFGRVYQVTNKETKVIHAVKAISKYRLKESLVLKNSLLNEIGILRHLSLLTL